MKIKIDRRRLKKGLDRRQFSYTAYSPEKRSGMDRRMKSVDFFIDFHTISEKNRTSIPA